MDAQQAVVADRMRGMFSRSRSGGDSSRSDSNSGDQSRRRSRGGFGGEPSAESQALQKAIDGKASNSEMKIAITRFLDARKQKQAENGSRRASQLSVIKVLSVLAGKRNRHGSGSALINQCDDTRVSPTGFGESSAGAPSHACYA